MAMAVVVSDRGLIREKTRSQPSPHIGAVQPCDTHNSRH